MQVSHALLGIFAAIAPAAAAALTALTKGNTKKFHQLLDPTVPLSRLIFRAPTQYYKTGIVFLAWLNGHQEHFIMVNGAQSARPLLYFSEAFKLADQQIAAIWSRGEADEILLLMASDATLAINSSPRLSVPAEESIAAIAAQALRHAAAREVEGRRAIAGMALPKVTYCRSTYLPAPGRDGVLAHIEDNKRALDDAAILGADSFVMVVGGLPRGSKDMARARAQVAEGTAALLEHGKKLGVRIALEPLHPVYAAERSCLTLLSEALDLCQAIEGPSRAPWLGVCIDAYHVWWDPNQTRYCTADGTSASSVFMLVTGWCRPAMLSMTAA
jgi:hypothetical protein